MVSYSQLIDIDIECDCTSLNVLAKTTDANVSRPKSHAIHIFTTKSQRIRMAVKISEIFYFNFLNL